RASVRVTSACDRMTCEIAGPTRSTGFSAAIGSWKTMPTADPRNLLRRRGESSSSEVCPSRICPDVLEPGGRRPRIARQVIDLPEPLSPTRPYASLAPTTNDTSRTISRPAMPTVRRSTRSPSDSRIDSPDVVREAVAEQADEESQDDDRKAREDHQPRIGDEEVPAVGDHRSPRRCGTLHSETEETDRRADQDVQDEVAHREDQRRRDDVRQKVPPHDAHAPVAETVRGEHVFALLRAQRLGAHEARVGDPAHRRDRDVEVAETGAQHRDDRDHEDEERKRREDVDETTADDVEQPAEVAG